MRLHLIFKNSPLLQFREKVKLLLKNSYYIYGTALLRMIKVYSLFSFSFFLLFFYITKCMVKIFSLSRFLLMAFFSLSGSARVVIVAAGFGAAAVTNLISQRGIVFFFVFFFAFFIGIFV